MISTVPDILARIVEHKRTELTELRPKMAEIERVAAARDDFRDFHAALTAKRPAIISEIKKASPSKGLLAATFDPPATAREYEAGGAAALSVLTDARFFQGSLADLAAARSAVAIPALRKDFTLEPLDVVQAVAAGADAILLIAAILSEREMRDLRELAEVHRLAALVEVHNADELEVALASGVKILGVNNRDLHTFEVRLETSLRLAERMPDVGLVKVSESGIATRADIETLSAAGYSAFLIGEHLMRSGQPRHALQELLQ